MSTPPISQQITRYAGGAAMAYAGISHLTFARKAWRAQVPGWVPIDADDTVVISGVLEIALGVGLVALPREREKMAGLTAAFLVAVFPGNISQFRHQADGVGLDSDRKRLVRLFAEPLMWAAALHAGGLLPGLRRR